MDYNSIASTAKRLIGSNGTKCVLRNPVEKPVYNPGTNEYEKQEEEFTGQCVVLNYADKLIDGTVIKAGDRAVTAVIPGVPEPGLSFIDVYDKAGNLADTYQVINSSPVNPNATMVILYKLQCRK